MLSFLKKIFGARPAEATPAPYKVDVGQFPFPKTTETSKPAAKAKKPAAKKPAAKKVKKSKEQ